MFKGLTFALAIAAAATCAAHAADFVLVAPDVGAKALTAEDEFTRALTPSDFSIRVKKDRARLWDLRKVYAGATLAWSADEQARLTGAIERNRARLDQLASWLPATIQLAKTSDAADGGLPHTRGSTIFFGPKLPVKDATLDFIFVHEIFHVLSRKNAARRDEFYALVGFEACKRVDMPRTLREQTITNPDAALMLHGAPMEDGTLLLPVLLSDPVRFTPAKPNFESYLSLHYYAMNRNAKGECALVLDQKSPREIDEKAALQTIYARAGRNTVYVLHPEEILADNFAQLIAGKPGAPDPWVYEKLAAFLGYVREFTPQSN